MNKRASSLKLPKNISDKFEMLTPNGADGQFMARCPAHTDHRPSLSIKVAGERILLHCFAGCEVDAIRKKAELSEDDLRLPAQVINYDYEDEFGNVLYQVQRYDGKKFTQRQPHPTIDGQWIPHIRGVDLVPFRLMELLAALSAGDPVYIVEGEKDALNMVASGAGVTATTNSGGAKNWTDEHSNYFAETSSKVFVIADRDPAGYARVIDVRESLSRIAGVEATLLLPREGKDASDHLVAHSIADFETTTPEAIAALQDGTAAKARQARVDERVENLSIDHDARVAYAAAGWVPPPPTRSLLDQLKQPPESLDMLIDKLAFVGANVLIIAAAKAGKTVLALNVIRSLLSGDPLFGEFGVAPLPAGRSVAWWNLELTERQALLWLRDMDIQNSDRFFPGHFRGHSLELESPSVEDWAVEWLTERKVTTWIIDPKSALFTGEENSATETGLWLQSIDRIKRRAGVETLILIHHAAGAIDLDESTNTAVRSVRGRGSSRMEGWADVLWSYVGAYEEPRYLTAFGRDIDVPHFGGIYMQPDRLLRWNGGNQSPAEDRLHKRALQIFDLVANADEPLRSGEIKAELSINKDSAIRAAVAYAVEQGWIVQYPGPGNSKLHTIGKVNPRRLQVTNSKKAQGSATQ